MLGTIRTKLASVSRDCGFTIQLAGILNEKLSQEDLNILDRWLQIVEDEKRTEVNRAKNSFNGPRRF